MNEYNYVDANIEGYLKTIDDSKIDDSKKSLN